MKIVRELKELRATLTEVRGRGKSIGFVPTMGALHAAHISLVKIARRESDFSVVSIFVNPAQFGPSEDLDRYPRTPEEDCELLEAEGVELVFLPDRKAMYGERAEIMVDPGPKAQIFEGRARPTHFRGVLTVVAKFFAYMQPDIAVFGEKDAQQLYLIRKMTEDLQFPVKIIAGPTLREVDGLALSSRNRYLTQAERKQATALYRALEAGAQVYKSGERSLEAVRAEMRRVIDEAPEFETDYFTAVDEVNFEEIDPLTENTRLIIAGKLGSVRLLDTLCPGVS